MTLIWIARSAALDTPRLARTLRDEAHCAAEHTEGMVNAVAEAMRADLSTKSDLRRVELRLEDEIETTRADLVKWLVGTVGFQTIAFLGAALALAGAVGK